MKNKILLLIITLLLIPTFVYAKDTCNDNDIKIKSISLKELNGFSEEVEESTINNNTINLNLKMYDVGDSSTYYITMENTSSEDYYFTKDSMKLENDYLEYSLKNDSETVPANSTKIIETAKLATLYGIKLNLNAIRKSIAMNLMNTHIIMVRICLSMLVPPYSPIACMIFTIKMIPSTTAPSSPSAISSLIRSLFIPRPPT